MRLKRALAPSLLCALLVPALPGAAQAQASGAGGNGALLPELLIIADRAAEPADRVASSVTVISREEIENADGQSVADLLATVPGLAVTTSGGLGGTSDVRIRGANPGHTLVLIDGVRVNDSANTNADFDFSLISLADVERIEILRGPQSGLYGSDAIGGVINIVTRRGSGPVSATASAMAGTHATFAERFAAAAGNEHFAASVGLSHIRSAGFSRFDEAEGGREADGAERLSLNGRFDAALGDSAELTLSLGHYRLDADLDDTGADSLDWTKKTLTIGSLTGRFDVLGGAVHNSVTLFAAATDRTFHEQAGVDSLFTGSRYGAEMQSDIAVMGRDRLTLGARIERESGEGEDVSGGTRTPRYDASQTTRSAFALYAFRPGEATTLTLAGRLDDFDRAGLYPTWRVTAAHRIAATGTRLRATYGTGAKAPTIQQKYEDTVLFGFLPVKGNPDLKVETSRGFDIGLDQPLLGGLATLSLTYFNNHIKDMIEYDAGLGTFINVAAARTQGVEAMVTLDPVDWATIEASYTYLRAIDATTGLHLQRRPENAGSLKVTLRPAPRLRVASALVYVGERFSGDGEKDPLAEYLRVDLSAAYSVNSHMEVFGRIENLFDTHYQEVKHFGAAGFSAYAGIKATF